MPRVAHACSNSAMNSAPLSTLMARTLKGIRAARASRTSAAAVAVARRPGSTTSQRLARPPGGELLQDEGRELADIERVELDEVELDEIARARDRPVLRGPHGIGPTPGPLPDADPASDMRVQRSAI